VVLEDAEEVGGPRVGVGVRVEREEAEVVEEGLARLLVIVSRI